MPEASRPEVPLSDINGLAALDGLGVDSIALFAYAGGGPLGGVGDLIDWRLMGRLGQAQAQGQFSGQIDAALLVPAPPRLGSAKVFVFGLGAPEHLTGERLANRLGAAVTSVAQAGARRLALVLPCGPETLEGVGGPSGLEDAFVAAGHSTNGHIIVKVLRHRVD